MMNSPPIRRRLVILPVVASLAALGTNMATASAATVPSSTLVKSGVSVRLAAGAVQFVGDQVSKSILAQPTFNNTMVAANPMATGSVLLSTWSASGTNWKAASAKTTVAKAAANDGTLNVTGQINNITADVSASITGLVNLRVSGTAVIPSTTFSGTAKIAPGTNGSVATVTVPTFKLSAHDLKVTVPGFPAGLVDPIVSGFQVDIQNQLGAKLRSVLASTVTSFANTFPASLPITAFGGTVHPAASVATVSGAGGSLDLTANAGLVPVTKNGPQGLTYNSVSTGPAPKATTTAPNGTSYPVGAVVSKDLVNQALAAVTQAGVLNTTLTSAQVPALSSIAPLLKLFNVSTTISNVRLRLVPSSAPSVSLATSGTSLGTIRLNDFTAIVDVQTSGQTTYTPLLSVTFSASAGFTLSQVSTSSLRPVLTSWPRVTGKSLTDLSSGLVLPGSVVDAIWSLIPSQLLPFVNSMLPAVDVPKVGPYTLGVGSIWLTNTSGNFVSFAGNLSSVPAADKR